MNETINQKKAYIYALVSVLLWSTVATAFKLTLRYTGYIELLMFSILFSFLSLLIMVLTGGRRKYLYDLRLKDYFKAALLGFLNPFLYYLLIFKAYTLLPAQLAQPLNQIWGVVIVLMSVPILKQKIGIRSVAGVIVSFFGVIVLSTGGRFLISEIENSAGIIFALLSSVVWSLYWIYNTKSKSTPLVSLFLNFGFGFFYIAVYYIFFYNSPGISLIALIGTLYIGLFEMGITFLLWLNALKYSMTIAKVSILIYLAPFFSLLFINYILKEKIRFSSLAGLIFIIGGILISRTEKKFFN